jgi:uncharacterized membrane protein
MYLLVYSVGGFVLERIINLVFLGYWWDNSVMIGPYQPLYGNGVVLTVWFAEFVLPRIKGAPWRRHLVLLIVAIAATALSEAVTGYSYLWLTDLNLWNYGQTFTCASPFVCLVPTSLFGILSFGVVVYLHPWVRSVVDRTPDWLFYPLFVVVMSDAVYTLITLLVRHL